MRFAAVLLVLVAALLSGCGDPDPKDIPEPPQEIGVGSAGKTLQ